MTNNERYEKIVDKLASSIEQSELRHNAPDTYEATARALLKDCGVEATFFKMWRTLEFYADEERYTDRYGDTDYEPGSIMYDGGNSAKAVIDE